MRRATVNCVRWGVSGGAALAPPDVGKHVSTGTPAVRLRWGVSGGAALAPPDVDNRPAGTREAATGNPV